VNKVVNIEIAKQVFWVEEQGYKALHHYLDNLKQQLASEEFGLEIFEDIELRFAELLYGVNEGKERAISLQQINEFIAQVGYLGAQEPVEKITPKTYLDDNNKIVAGVCAGLSVRLGIPAFLIRLVFIGAIGAFGFGLVMYLILWFSFDKNNSRNKVLASQGQQLTAQKISQVSDLPRSKFLTIERIVFLPFSVLGIVLHVLGKSIFANKGFFQWILKNSLLIALIFTLLSLVVGIMEFNHDQIFNQWLQWILSVSAIYLMVLGGVVFIREYYLAKPYRLVNKTLKKFAILPAVLIISSIAYLMSEMIDERSLTNDTVVAVNNNIMTLRVIEPNIDNYLARDVDIELIASPKLTDEVKVSIIYSSNGRGSDALDENIQAINYQYTIVDNILTLDRYFELFASSFNRGQHVTVRVEVPQNINIHSSHTLTVTTKRQVTEYEIDSPSQSVNNYMTSSAYFHENNEVDAQRVTHNERKVLLDKFCDVFFDNLQWKCRNSEEMPRFNDDRFDVTYRDERSDIYALASTIKQQQTLDVVVLNEINDKIEFLKPKHPQVDGLHLYIQHLLHIKRPPPQTVAAPR